MAKVKMNQSTNTGFMKAVDLLTNGKPSRSITLHIENVTEKTWEDGRTSYTLAFTEGAKSLSLNATNLAVVVGEYGDETEDWKDKPVTLKAEKLAKPYNGQEWTIKLSIPEDEVNI